MFFFIVLISFSLLATILFNFKEPLQHTLPVPRPSDADLSLKEITLTNTQAGSASWRLSAEAADFNLQTKSGRLKNIRVVFFDSDKGDMELTADQGEVGPDGGSFRAIGNVILKNAQGQALFSDDLEYLQEGSLIRTESRVRIAADGLVLLGRGLRYQVRERLFQLLNEIEASLYEKTDARG
ncbi:MAG: LPS export ABC transporter periplasmic protein LptC [Deltaproteobacteria bacterium]|nr:LPS export ABC transporter periplasmic protein LptC [Deltaproteobacteria bacterium]